MRRCQIRCNVNNSVWMKFERFLLLLLWFFIGFERPMPWKASLPLLNIFQSHFTRADFVLDSSQSSFQCVWPIFNTLSIWLHLILRTPYMRNTYTQSNTEKEKKEETLKIHPPQFPFSVIRLWLRFRLVVVSIYIYVKAPYSSEILPNWIWAQYFTLRWTIYTTFIHTQTHTHHTSLSYSLSLSLSPVYRIRIISVLTEGRVKF